MAAKMIPANQHPAYDPFLRMIKVHVPKHAVQAKMKAAGLNVAVLEQNDLLVPIGQGKQVLVSVNTTGQKLPTPKIFRVFNRVMSHTAYTFHYSHNVNVTHIRTHYFQKASAHMTALSKFDTSVLKPPVGGTIVKTLGDMFLGAVRTAKPGSSGRDV